MITNHVAGHMKEREHIAYFTMEVGISHRIPTYAGGLGILAGDTLKSFADLGIPVVGISLLNEQGYFYQRLDGDGNQIEDPVHWSVGDLMVQLPNVVTVRIDGRQVKVKAWQHMIRGIKGSSIPMIFLDTNLPENAEYDRTLTSHLYSGDRYYRLCQEMVLGVGGMRMLDSLGYTNVKKYHMNEGHAALLTIELLRKTYHDAEIEENSYDIDSVKDKTVFTTHTPVAAGHDRFDLDLFKKVVGDYVPEFIIKKAFDGEKVNMTLLGLTFSRYINGVAKRHKEVTEEMFPEYQIDSITNGIHPVTWASIPFKNLFNKHIPGWCADPYSLRNALSMPKDDVWQAHDDAKNLLIDEINQRANVGFDSNRFTIGYARRFTAYKRPDLLLFDIERLKSIAEQKGDIQVVYAGKAHQADQNGKDIIKRVVHLAREINAQNCKLKIIFLDGYDMRLAKLMVSGCDVWLNTPQRPYEASGTSGMKAALNGVPHFSTLDGWWLEGHIEHTTGWSIGAHPHDPDFKHDPDPRDEAEDLYNKLENVVLPCFYGDRDKWINIMRHCIAINGSFFNTYRMAQQYIAGAYLD